VVETEAYLGFDDPASHAYRGRRHAQNQSIYCLPGTWYVYRSYGIHWCANLVAGPQGLGAAVLLRGIQIERGGEIVASRRPGVPPASWTNGPGKLCQALAIDKSIDGVQMRTSSVRVHTGEVRDDEAMLVTPRIGISKATDWPLRFLLSSRRP